MSADDTTTIAFVRRALLGVLLLGVVGTQVELLLLKHFEDAWQFAPLVLNGLAIVVVIWQAWRPGVASLRALQGLMLLFILSGAVGVILHYRGNVDWELERTPGLAGFALFKMAVTGATPALAPGAMLQLGLVGLLYAFRHPLLRDAASPSRGNHT